MSPFSFDGRLWRARVLRLLILTPALLGVSVSAAAAPSRRMPTATRFAGMRTVGALFSSANPRFHFCTASVIHSPRGDLLLTAAHCVHGSGAGLVFAPGVHDGIAAYGRWAVTGAYVDPDWVSRQDPRRDFAFLTVAPEHVNGQVVEIEQVTGAERLAIHAARGRTVTVPGYPAGTDNEPVRCTARVYYHGRSPAFDCDEYVGGTSGAPWLARTGTGRAVVALIGGLHQGGCFAWTSYSPPFGAPVLRAYDRAAAHSSPDQAPAAGDDGCA